MEKSNKEKEESWHDNPEKWKLGVFYYNKNDKRIFTAKRNPDYGIMLNFANPKSYLVMLFSALFFGFILFKINQNK